jgi:hypothetical protein
MVVVPFFGRACETPFTLFLSLSKLHMLIWFRAEIIRMLHMFIHSISRWFVALRPCAAGADAA